MAIILPALTAFRIWKGYASSIFTATKFKQLIFPTSDGTNRLSMTVFVDEELQVSFGNAKPKRKLFNRYLEPGIKPTWSSWTEYW
jgi:hypothetical protein